MPCSTMASSGRYAVVSVTTAVSAIGGFYTTAADSARAPGSRTAPNRAISIQSSENEKGRLHGGESQEDGSGGVADGGGDARRRRRRRDRAVAGVRQGRRRDAVGQDPRRRQAGVDQSDESEGADDADEVSEGERRPWRWR